MGAIAQLRRLILLALAVSVVVAPLSLAAPGAAHAQRRMVEPRDVALRPSDLPPGFVVVPDRTSTGPLAERKGVLFTLLMQQSDEARILSGPAVVSQVIARFDEGVAFGGWLDDFRSQRIRQDGFTLVPGAPNDGGTASLVKHELLQGGTEAAHYVVGFIKNEMIVFTEWYGVASVVDLQGVLTLAGVTSARYDAVVAGTAPSAVAAPAAAGAPAPRAARTAAAPAAGPVQVGPLPGAPLDARGRPLDGFVIDVAASINQYWVQTFARNGRAYAAPRVRWVAEGGAATACSARRIASPAYCGRDGTIYLYAPFFAELWRSERDFAVVTVLAHEWGHHVQVLLGVPPSGVSFELQADCLAGRFAGYGAAEGYLEPGDLDEGVAISWHAGDVAHGTGAQRAESFLRGYNGDGCGI